MDSIELQSKSSLSGAKEQFLNPLEIYGQPRRPKGDISLTGQPKQENLIWNAPDVLIIADGVRKQSLRVSD